MEDLSKILTEVLSKILTEVLVKILTENLSKILAEVLSKIRIEVLLLIPMEIHGDNPHRSPWRPTGTHEVLTRYPKRTSDSPTQKPTKSLTRSSVVTQGKLSDKTHILRRVELSASP